MKTMDEITSLVVLWQKLPNGVAKDDIYMQVHASLQGAMHKNLTYFSKASGQTADLLQEMAIGLLGCMNRFKPEVGVKFSTYYIASIREALQMFNRNQQNHIQMPLAVYRDRTANETIPAMLAFDEPYANKNDGATHQENRWAIFDSEDDRWLKEIENIEMKIDYYKLTHKLKPVELQVLLARMEGALFKEIGKKHGITLERSRQIFNDAMAVLCKQKRPSQEKRERAKK